MEVRGVWKYLKRVYEIMRVLDTMHKRILTRNDVPKYTKIPTNTVYRILADLREHRLVEYKQTRWGKKPVLTDLGKKMKEVLGEVFREE